MVYKLGGCRFLWLQALWIETKCVQSVSPLGRGPRSCRQLQSACRSACKGSGFRGLLAYGLGLKAYGLG